MTSARATKTCCFCRRLTREESRWAPRHGHSIFKFPLNFMFLAFLRTCTLGLQVFGFFTSFFCLPACLRVFFVFFGPFFGAMKFGHQLQRSAQEPEFVMNYIHYKKLKKLLKRMVRTNSPKQQPQTISHVGNRVHQLVFIDSSHEASDNPHNDTSKKNPIPPTEWEDLQQNEFFVELKAQVENVSKFYSEKAMRILRAHVYGSPSPSQKIIRRDRHASEVDTATTFRADRSTTATTGTANRTGGKEPVETFHSSAYAPGSSSPEWSFENTKYKVRCERNSYVSKNHHRDYHTTARQTLSTNKQTDLKHIEKRRHEHHGSYHHHRKHGKVGGGTSSISLHTHPRNYYKLTRIDEIYIQARELQIYAEMNITAVRKILKKFDKMFSKFVNYQINVGNQFFNDNIQSKMFFIPEKWLIDDLGVRGRVIKAYFLSKNAIAANHCACSNYLTCGHHNAIDNEKAIIQLHDSQSIRNEDDDDPHIDPWLPRASMTRAVSYKDPDDRILKSNRTDDLSSKEVTLKEIWEDSQQMQQQQQKQEHSFLHNNFLKLYQLQQYRISQTFQQVTQPLTAQSQAKTSNQDFKQPHDHYEQQKKENQQGPGRCSIVANVLSPSTLKSRHASTFPQMAATNMSHVFNVKNEEQVPQEFICPICLDILITPVLLNCCKNQLCYKCLVSTIEIVDKCPLCRKENMFEQCQRSTSLECFLRTYFKKAYYRAQYEKVECEMKNSIMVLRDLYSH